ncbi:MAG: Zn-ribbon domain-containing OB-fold protein [Gammaproteobacteria bacterium]|nr:Zn-ribbon domain-containing OB-fold protein [Gammaproteobacteria bacterium]MYD80687.1 Zn-ribbon domain-containing OB-fold protein [Gammaproteobacteria bacterium]
MEFEKPLPLQSPAAIPFWKALQEETVLLQQCDECSHWVFYPRNHCPRNLGNSLTWREVSGEGVLYSYTVARQPTAPHFADEVPQLLAIVELKEGVRMTSTIVGVDPNDLKVGMPLVPYFDHVTDDVTLLRFTVRNSKRS